MKAHSDTQMEKNCPTGWDKPPGPVIVHKPLFNLAIDVNRINSDSLSA